MEQEQRQPQPVRQLWRVQQGPQQQAPQQPKSQEPPIILAAGAVMQLAVQPGCRLRVLQGRVTVLGPPRWLGGRVWWPERGLAAAGWCDWSQHGIVELRGEGGGATLLWLPPEPYTLSWRRAYGAMLAWLSQALPAAIQRRVRRRARPSAQAGSPGQ